MAHSLPPLTRVSIGGNLPEWDPTAVFTPTDTPNQNDVDIIRRLALRTGVLPGWGWGVGAVGLGIGLGLAATAPWGWGGYGYPPYGGYGYPYGAVGWGYGGTCYPVTQQIWTPWGWRWRQVQVC